MKPIIVT